MPDFKPNPEFNIPKKPEESKPVSQIEYNEETKHLEKNIIQELNEFNCGGI